MLTTRYPSAQHKPANARVVVVVVVPETALERAVA